MNSKDKCLDILQKFQKLKSYIIDIAQEVYIYTVGEEIVIKDCVDIDFTINSPKKYLILQRSIKLLCVEFTYDDDFVCKVIFPKEFLSLSPVERKERMTDELIDVKYRTG